MWRCRHWTLSLKERATTHVTRSQLGSWNNRVSASVKLAFMCLNSDNFNIRYKFGGWLSRLPPDSRVQIHQLYMYSFISINFSTLSVRSLASLFGGLLGIYDGFYYKTLEIVEAYSRLYPYRSCEISRHRWEPKSCNPIKCKIYVIILQLAEVCHKWKLGTRSKISQLVW